MKIILIRPWRNSKTGEQHVLGAELDVPDAQAKKLINAGYARVFDPAADVESDPTVSETEPAVSETEPTVSETDLIDSENEAIVSQSIDQPEDSPGPVSEETAPVPAEEESRRMRRKREAYDQN